MQVTISLLPVSLSLVHIPRSRLSQLSHPVLRQILHPNPGFLNITCNEVELSIFAEEHMLEDFEPIARKDRHRQRSRAGSSSSRKGETHSTAFHPVEISYERWSVLQIDSHSDQMDNSGARVRELSAPLAAAGISILYQSSYMSDFIFVKESRIQEVMSLCSKAGFDLYYPPGGAVERPLSRPDSPSSNEQVPTCEKPSHVPGAVLTLSGSSSTVSLENNFQSSCSVGDRRYSQTGNGEPGQSSQNSPRSKSHSPTTSEVRILEPDLACVGLSDEFGVDHWGLKIVKLVAFPDLIPPNPGSRLTSRNSSVTDFSEPPSRSSLYEPYSPVSLKITRPFTPSSSSSSSDDDGYFSHSPQNVSTVSLSSVFSRSFTELPSAACRPSPFRPASKHFSSTMCPAPISIPSKRPTYPAKPKPQVPPVSFFSFTRTPEGSSLTADVYVLATLFPPHERHMVICSGELDAADDRMEGTDSDDEEDGFDSSLSLKCLQIDLRRFGLDKHGLVNRFSRVLEQNGINHMYSSTFKTANLLVDKKHAVRAQSVLRSC